MVNNKTNYSMQTIYHLLKTPRTTFLLTEDSIFFLYIFVATGRGNDMGLPLGCPRQNP